MPHFSASHNSFYILPDWNANVKKMFKATGHCVCSFWQPFEISEGMMHSFLCTWGHLTYKTWNLYSELQSVVSVFLSLLWFFVLSFLVQLWGITESSWCEHHGRSSPSESATSACQMRASTRARSSPCPSRPPRPFSLSWVGMSLTDRLLVAKFSRSQHAHLNVLNSRLWFSPPHSCRLIGK